MANVTQAPSAQPKLTAPPHPPSPSDLGDRVGNLESLTALAEIRGTWEKQDRVYRQAMRQRERRSLGFLDPINRLFPKPDRTGRPI